MIGGRGHWARIAAGIVLGALFLWLTLRRVDGTGVLRAAAAIPWQTFAIALAAIAMGYYLRILRWWVMLRGADSTLKVTDCAWPLIVGFGVNNVMPLRAGDAVRVFGFRRHLHAPPARLLATVVGERLLDLFVLLGFFFIGLTASRIAVPVRYVHVCTTVAGAAILTWLAVVLLGPRLAAQLQRPERTPPTACGVRARVKYDLGQFLQALVVLRTPASALLLWPISAGVWVCEGGAFAAVAYGLQYDGAPIGPWFALATATLGTLVPSTPGYVGTFDFFAMSGLMAYGAGRELAAAFALLVHAILWAPLTLAAAGYLLVSSRRDHALTTTSSAIRSVRDG